MTQIYLPPCAASPYWGIATEYLPAPMTARLASRGPANRTAGKVDASKASDGLATITLAGPMIRGATADDEDYFGGVVDLDDALAVVQAATADPDISRVMMIIRSPGGTVDGSFELSDAICELSDAKPTATFYDGLGASAAFLAGSQTRTSSAYRSAMVGSVGVRMGLYDFSELFKQMGIEAVPIDSGGMKSAGMLGAPLTADQRAYFKSIVDKYAMQFTGDLSRGRGVSQSVATGWADGKINTAGDAQRLGMIDHVETRQEATSRLRAQPIGKRTAAAREKAQTQTKGNGTMGKSKPAEKPYAAELTKRAQAMMAASGGKIISESVAKLEVFKADQDFHDKFLKEGEDDTSARKSAAAAEKKNAMAAAGAASAYQLRLRELMKENKWSMAKAMTHIRENEPELYDRLTPASGGKV